MNRLLLTSAAVLALAGCETPGQIPPTAPSLLEQQEIAAEILKVPSADRPEVGAGLALEIGARFRCPRSLLESQLLFLGRLGFDQFVRPRVQPESLALVYEHRRRADLACHITVTPAP